MRPHEEEWRIDDVIVMYNREDGQKEAREVLAHAAPDMARALLEHCEACDSCHGTGVIMVCDMEIHTPVACPGCSDDRDVLRKAGVL